MKSYVQGAVVRLRARFYNSAGALFDPTTVRFSTYREADEETDIYTYVEPDSSSDSSDPEPGEVVKEATGVYFVDIDTLEQSGIWEWRATSEGPSRTAEQKSFYVRPSLIEDSESSSSS